MEREQQGYELKVRWPRKLGNKVYNEIFCENDKRVFLEPYP